MVLSSTQPNSSEKRSLLLLLSREARLVLCADLVWLNSKTSSTKLFGSTKGKLSCLLKNRRGCDLKLSKWAKKRKKSQFMFALTRSIYLERAMKGWLWRSLWMVRCWLKLLEMDCLFRHLQARLRILCLLEVPYLRMGSMEFWLYPYRPTVCLSDPSAFHPVLRSRWR